MTDLQSAIAQLMGLDVESVPVVRNPPALKGRWNADGTPYDAELMACIKNVRKTNNSHKLSYCVAG